MCSPGDIVNITGIYLPSPYSGFAAMSAGLTHDTHIEAYKITKDRVNYKEFMLSEDMLAQVLDLKEKAESDEDLFKQVS